MKHQNAIDQRSRRYFRRLRPGRRDVVTRQAGADAGHGRAPNESGHTLRDLVIITGLSGAGKSAAMAVFEDAGYFCVDNLPPEMIGSLAALFEHRGSKVELAAIVSDARGGSYFEVIAPVLDQLADSGVAFRILFLDADDQTIVNRFKETRRRHPLAPQTGAAEGIAAERRILEPIHELADAVIDTTELSPAALRRVIAEDFLTSETRGKLAVTFMTFGFKHGPPRNVDLSFDVRFLPNPHYVPELRELTGLDAPVRDYVTAAEGIDEFYTRLVPLLDYLLPAYAEEGKQHLTIGIGCTGGRHRSVVIAEHLASVYRQNPDLTVEVAHRDVDKRSRV
ncbi:MAG: RNase adapter RapZ [Thermoleophilia bacterium]|nr:RNase adapter RapZ [Thermoleophilia bacterium]